jgi:CopG family transcriptional regulator/antitoxin EndoAI
MATTSRTSKTYTISLPPELAAKAEYLARRDSRTMSELFREAFRNYYARQTQELFDEAAAYAATRNPHGYTEADVPRLIKEVRASKPIRSTKTRARKVS